MTGSSGLLYQGLVMGCPVVKGLVPDFQAQQTPNFSGKSTGRLKVGQYLVRVDVGTIALLHSIKNPLDQALELIAKPLLQWNGEAHFVSAVNNPFGQHAFVGFLDQMFHVSAGELDLRRGCGDALHQAMIQKRHPAFEPMSHAHPVFDLQQCRQ